MPDYGLTPQGPNIKRLDIILDDMHTSLSEKWGVNTRQNPESLINHLLTNIADALAELWEFGEKIYYSQYPASAEGQSLDSAAQYGGSTREQAAKSYYPIHCKGTDGTVLDAGTTIASATNPVTLLSLTEPKTISLNACNGAEIKIRTFTTNSSYTVSINGVLFTAAATGSITDLLNALATAINAGDGFAASVDTETMFLTVMDEKPENNSNNILLSENLTTETVTSVFNFGTEETGDIYLPDGVITNIVRADARLTSVVNKCGYIPGRDAQTDAEFRQSYADKIFNRSSMMLESIRSALLNNVQGVKSVAAYENSSNETMVETAVIAVSNTAAGTFSVTINGTTYSVSNSSADADTILGALSAAITSSAVTKDVDAGDHTLTIEFTSLSEQNSISVSSNLSAAIGGRPPHSIEVVVDGGDNTEVAKQIFEKKAAGIQTHGSVSVTIPGNYDEDITVKFNRPQTIYVWFAVSITQLPGSSLPTNYANLIKEVILKKIDSLDAGDEVIPQTFVSELYNACPGIAYIDIMLYHTANQETVPISTDYTERIVTITARQRAETSATKIGVTLVG